MSREVHGAPTAHTLLVWAVLTGAVSLTLALLRPELGLAARLTSDTAAGGDVLDRTPFVAALAAACAVVLAGCLLWGWLVATVLAVGVLTRLPLRLPPCPAVLRRGLLAACGVAVVAATAAPAQADLRTQVPAERPPLATGQDPGRGVVADRSPVAGLPLPERPTGGPVPPAAPPAPSSWSRVEVRAGDTLWGLARDLLPPGADPRTVDRLWRAVHEANRAVVGADPDLILPGTVLEVPDLPTAKES